MLATLLATLPPAPQKLTLRRARPRQGYPAHGYPAQGQQQQGWQQGQGQQQQPYTQHANSPPMVAHNVSANDTSVQAAHSYSSCGECFNMQWVLFILGFFFFFPAALGVLLPFCQRGRLQRDPSYRLGWIGNCVLAALWILGAILSSILVHNQYRSGINQPGNNVYG
jgi:hypothetical protein